MTTFILTVLFCTTYDCATPMVVKTYFSDQQEAVERLSIMSPGATPRLFQVVSTEQPDHSVVTTTREVTLGPAPDFTPFFGPEGAVVPE